MSVVVPAAHPFFAPSLHGLRRLFTTMRLAVLACLVLSGSILASIATTTDPLWWKLHFSRLGTLDDVSAGLFNYGLVAAGAIVTVYAHAARRDLQRLGRRAARRGTGVVTQVCLSAIGVNLAMVGLVPLDVNKPLHDNVAAGMVLGFVGLLLTSPVMMHRMPRRLIVTTSVIFVCVFAGAWLFVTETINLTLFEVIAFLSMFAWAGVFTHCLGIRATTPHASALSAPDAAAAGPAATPAHRAPRSHRRPLRPQTRAIRRRPSVRPAAPSGARGRLPRGGTAWAARAASARWTTRARRSPRWPGAER